MDNKVKEKMELVHKPVKGYRTAFHIIVAIAAGYLTYILIGSFPGGQP
jgi:hypothetical protein